MRRAISTFRIATSLNRLSVVRSCVACLLVLLTIGATNLEAQPEAPRRDRNGEERRDRRGDRPPFGGGPSRIDLWRMLEFPSVRNELNLSDAEFTELGRFHAEMRKPKPDEKTKADKKKAWEKLSDEQRKEKFDAFKIESKKIREKYESKLEEVLDEDQFTRMQQIRLQIRGLAALFEKEVAEEIGLTPSQKDRIHESIRSSMRQAMHAYFKTERSERKMSMRDKMHEIRPAVEAKALEVLTEQQAAKFKEMQGIAFEIPEEELRRRGRPQKAKSPRGGPPRGARGDQPDKRKECGADRK